MRGYVGHSIKTFLTINDLCLSQRDYDRVKHIYEDLLLSEVTHLDWLRLEKEIFRATPTLKSKWDVARLIYNFLKREYGEKIAIQITWIFMKHFKLLFEKAYYSTFYHPTSEAIWLLEQLGQSEKYNMSKTKHAKQHSLTKFFSTSRGVRV